MNPFDLTRVVEKYMKRFEQFGVDIKTLASGNPERREIRFKSFSSIGDFKGCSVLDIGCGFGDFNQYLLDHQVEVDYHGIDICPAFIDVCRERFPQAAFEVNDFQNFKPSRPYDYIICSQVFNTRYLQEDNLQVMKDVIKKAYGMCKVATAIDMTTDYVDFKDDTLYYYSPEEIFSYSKSLTKRVLLKHDYPLYEFTIVLYKDFSGWGKA